MQRQVGDHFRLDRPLPAISGDRTGPRLSVRAHLLPHPRHQVTRCILLSRHQGVFPADVELLPLDIGQAAPVAGEA